MAVFASLLNLYHNQPRSQLRTKMTWVTKKQVFLRSSVFHKRVLFLFLVLWTLFSWLPSVASAPIVALGNFLADTRHCGSHRWDIERAALQKLARGLQGFYTVLLEHFYRGPLFGASPLYLDDLPVHYLRVLHFLDSNYPYCEILLIHEGWK